MSVISGSTLQDVARRAGVSTATVSRVLNAPHVVRSATRERVEEAINTLGYTPHFGGRALASNRTNTIGAVIPTMENAIFAVGLQALQDELAVLGNTLLVATSHYDVDREFQQIRALLARGVDGLVLIGEERPAEVYEFLLARSVPFVLVWSFRADSPHTCIGFDNHAAARQMARAVLSAGHRHIAMIAGVTTGNDRAAARVAGVREALDLEGVTLEPPFLVEVPYGLDQSMDAARDLVCLAPRPTAIICGNDVLAVGAIRGVRACGLAVPDDMSIVGFDDIDIARVIEPALTTVHVPHRRMGRAAARQLVSIIAEENAGSGVVFETEIVDRDSLAPPAAQQ